MQSDVFYFLTSYHKGTFLWQNYLTCNLVCVQLNAHQSLAFFVHLSCDLAKYSCA